ncbi:hypothetical protein GOP47_0009362 [Adiantum capillus-veneris]|uniref:Uncharacterized protein n=1 Tax=Adiantum capillus-veneris TaxID=13818 RepID=A0A9D4UWJ7_ADICA|nr:hypothetical protein GOP47_0009362 [Adiantum capillus-veneris]
MQAHCLINIPRNYGSQDEPGCFGSCVPGYDSRPRSDWIRRIADNVDKGVCNRLLGRVLDGHGGEKIVAQYEQSLLWARTGASVIGFLYKLAKNLTFWSLTWATVVILGAYVDNLHPGDYYYIILILLIEGTRLPLAAFFTQLLIYYDIPPGHILSQHQLSYLTQLSTNFSIPLRLLSALLQVLFITPNIVLSFIRLVHMHVHTYPTKQPTQYYVHSSLHLKLQPTGKAEKSLLKYFDQVLYHATAEGVLNEKTMKDY